MPFSSDQAQVLGLQAVTWLVGNDALLPVFLGSTGAGLEDLRAGVSDPAMHGAVLDFILMDDAWVQDMCNALSLSYETLAQARAALPGGANVHWT